MTVLCDSVIKPAYELNVKHIIVKGECKQPSFMSVDADNIIIETIKPCEDNERIYHRLYDAEGTYTNTTLNLNKDANRLKLLTCWRRQ